jgi:DNA topoisomerase-1
MENDLDRIADGEADRSGWLSEFYFGTDKHRGLRGVVDNLGDIDAREINSVRLSDDITLRIGRYGPYLEVAEDGAAADAPPRRVNIPAELAPDELTVEKARELVDAPEVGERVLGINPANGKQVVAKEGRFGPYVTEVEAEEAEAEAVGDGAKSAKPKKKTAEKPRTASLFKSMDPHSIDLDTALKLLDLPRVVGADPETGEEITAQNGRYGPYLKKGTDTRSLDSEDLIFDVDLDGALAIFAQPKYGARKASSALKEFDADPVSGKPIRIKDGRFGPYVTDGVTNATIPRGEEVETVDFDRAVELLADKRAKGPAKKAPAKKPAARGTTASTRKKK